MKKLIAIMGEAGSGKDTILSALCDKYPDKYHKKVSYTTRPMREGEVDSIDYHFVSETFFYSTDMIEKCCFNNWWYGTSYNSLVEDKINIGIFTPSGLRQIMQDKDIDVKVYYIFVPDKQRLLRQLAREKNPNIEEILRRYYADKEDFKDLSDIPHFTIYNPDGVSIGDVLAQATFE